MMAGGPTFWREEGLMSRAGIIRPLAK